jgi:hypothetical protein
MLARIALRIAAVEALKGQTLVGDNVLDSQIGALDVAADGTIRTDQQKPFLSVYVEGSKVENGLELRGLHRSGQTEFMIEIGITTAMTVTDSETGVSEVIPGLPATDPAFEFYLDVVGRQIVNALSDPNNAWAEIWRGLSSSVVKIERKRTSDAASGTRIAAHQLVITLELLPDPVFGEPIAPTSIWAKLFAQMESAEHPFLPTLQSLVGDPTGVLDHEAQRRRRGMTLDEARALLGMAPEVAETTEPNIAVTVEQVP